MIPIKKTGTSLIEIIIAIFILACAFLPILRVVDYGSVSTAKIGHYAKATRLAQELIEECKHVPFKSYQKYYTTLTPDKEFDIHPEFYKETKANIEKFMTEGGEKGTKDKLKDFTYKAILTVKKNDLDLISEVWFEVEISWYDVGKISDAKGEKKGS
jgi:hypothetical protein